MISGQARGSWLFDCTKNAVSVIVCCGLLSDNPVRAEVPVMNLRPSDRTDLIQPRSLPPRLVLQSSTLHTSFLEQIPPDDLELEQVSPPSKLHEDEQYVLPRRQTLAAPHEVVASYRASVFKGVSVESVPTGARGFPSPTPALENDYNPLWPECCLAWHHEPLSPLVTRTFRTDVRRDSDSSHDEVSEDKPSQLPDIVPPAHHTAKTIALLVGASLAGFVFYGLAPQSATNTDTSEGLQGGLDNIGDAWTKPPVVDEDPPIINYLGHPMFGMLFYLSQRNYNESPLYSFAFSALMSTGFEYLFEAAGERPSIQDLLITPIVGSILGELSYWLTQEMRKDGLTTSEKVILTIVNPLYVMQNGYR